MSRSTTWGRWVPVLLLWAAAAAPATALAPRLPIDEPFANPTWWFAALSALAAAVAVGLALRLRASAAAGRALAAQVESKTRELLLAKEHAERAMRESARAKSELLANLSHELRTPLNAILGLADVLLSGDLRPDHRRHVEAVRTSGESLLTLFNEVLGFAPSEAGAAARQPAGAPPPYAGTLAARFPHRILVAEDNAVNRRVLLLMLERFGYRAEVAGNGFEVLFALSLARFDLVLMDVQMPGMDGLEATRRIRRELPPASQPRIVALTAHARSEDRQACLAAGMDEFLTKPIRPEQLCAALSGGEASAPCHDGRGAAVDAARLARLQDVIRQDGGSVLAEVVGCFLCETPRRLDQIRRALEREDRMAVGHLAHSLEGSCLLIGALRLSEECRALQERAAVGSLHLAREIFAAVEEELARVAAALAPYRPVSGAKPVEVAPAHHAALDL